MRKYLMALGIGSLMITNVYGKSITLNINGAIVSTPVAPVQEAGTTLVPLRIISENLGATLGWDGPSQTVTIKKDGTEIKLVINSKTVTVNGGKSQVLVAPKLMSETTMVPLRFISENLDSDVDWDGPSQTVFVKRKIMEETHLRKILYDNGTYEGEVVMRDGVEVFHGQGRFVFLDGEIQEGSFKNDMLNGEAKIFYVDGSTYVGTFKDNRCNGYGKHTNGRGDYYEGQFKDDLFHGEGQYVFESGESYKGGFKNDLRHGQGKAVYSDGSTYVGDYKEDRFNGKGKYVYVNGDFYEGGFKDNLFHGQGKYTFVSGKVHEGLFDQDEFIGK